MEMITNKSCLKTRGWKLEAGSWKQYLMFFLEFEGWRCQEGRDVKHW